MSELVAQYHVSFVATAKHINVLEKAHLITKRKEGKKYMVTLAPGALQSADKYLEQYRTMWRSRHDKLSIIAEGRLL